MRIIGLTGGIASGKSTVSRMLRELGATVLDADAVYHELIAPQGGQASPLAQAVASAFPGVLRPDGTLDRAELGRRVFSDAAARQRLGAITHPAVAMEVGRRSQALAASGLPVLIYDVPLLYENGLDAGMDGVIVVWVSRASQRERLCARDGLTPTEAEQRLSAQLPLDRKRDRATWVIDNEGTLEDTRAQVQRLWRELSA